MIYLYFLGPTYTYTYTSIIVHHDLDVNKYVVSLKCLIF